MSKIILQPAGNPDAREHYVDTIDNPVELNRLNSFVNQNDANIISRIYPNGAYVWGVTPGKNLSNMRKWQRIEKGDVCLFSRAGHIFASGVVTYKIHNKNLALDLWKTDENGNTWEYVFFLDEITNLRIPYRSFNEVVGYVPNFVIQGFNILDQEKSDRFFESFDLKSKVYFSESSINNRKNEFKLWLIEKHGKTGTPSSYIKAIDLLNEKLDKEIFNITDLSYLKSLFDDLLKEQANSESKYLDLKKPSYGQKGFYSASIKSYIEFLKEKKEGVESQYLGTTNIEKIKFLDKDKNTYELKISIQDRGRKNPEYKLTWKSDFKRFLNTLENTVHQERAKKMGYSFPLYYLSIEKVNNEYFVSKKIVSSDYWNKNSHVLKFGTKGTWVYWNDNNVGLKLRQEIRRNLSVAIPSVEEGSNKLIKFFRITKSSSFIMDEFLKTNNMKKIMELEKTDKITFGKMRLEQKHLRKFLFGSGIKDSKCGICKKEFPVDLLWCSHIKKRSECTYEERIDYNNIVMPMCKLGCDDLYEKQYIYVDSKGVVYPSNKVTTKDLRMVKLVNILNTKIEAKYINKKTMKYFKHHKQEIENINE